MAGLGGSTAQQTSQVPANTSQVIAGLIAPRASGSYLGSSPTPNFGAIPVNTQTSSRTSSGTSNTTSKKKSKSVTDSLQREQGRVQNMEQSALDTLNATIAQLSAGEDPVLAAIDQAALGGLARNQEVDQQLDPFDASSRAQGRVQGFQRELLESILPGILGGAEDAGGTSAIAQLLSQDAATRTSEASARVEEEAYSNAINQRIANQNALQGLLGEGGVQNEALLDALGLAKGAVELTDKTTTGRSTTTGEETTDSTTTSSGSESGTLSGSDPIEWAKLQAQLAMFGASQPTAQEKAIAMFQATKSPGMDLNRALNPKAGMDMFSPMNPSIGSLNRSTSNFFKSLGGRI